MAALNDKPNKTMALEADVNSGELEQSLCRRTRLHWLLCNQSCESGKGRLSAMTMYKRRSEKVHLRVATMRDKREASPNSAWLRDVGASIPPRPGTLAT
jgi:hypothetical protein